MCNGCVQDIYTQLGRITDVYSANIHVNEVVNDAQRCEIRGGTLTIIVTNPAITSESIQSVIRTNTKKSHEAELTGMQDIQVQPKQQARAGVFLK